MTIGGFRLSDTQRAVLVSLHDYSTLGQWNRRTRTSLVRLGLIESFVPEARTLAMAERGRVRYYRLTTAGKTMVEVITKQLKARKREKP
jgi:hypothetical protein